MAMGQPPSPPRHHFPHPHIPYLFLPPLVLSSRFVAPLAAPLPPRRFLRLFFCQLPHRSPLYLRSTALLLLTATPPRLVRPPTTTSLRPSFISKDGYDTREGGGKVGKI
ncbi:hypothetical protein Sjap_000787 [Stephania japonica]|uniref:Uncharacterized protein n=1 Tax=Stephania japonica TaxID=461633 RepID=A0AAP0PR35_9MAGN